MKKDIHQTQNGDELQQGVTTTTFVVAFFGVIIIVLILAAYVVISDRINGLDAYRVRAMREERDGYKAACEENHKSLQAMQEWIRRQTTEATKTAPYLILKPCVQPQNLEEQAKKEH